MQHAMRMRHTVICGLPGSIIFFTHHRIKSKIFEGKNFFNIKCVLILSETFFIVTKKNRRDIINVYLYFEKKIQVSDLKKTRSVGVLLLQASG